MRHTEISLPPFIQINYQNRRFVYSRSYTKPINQMIAIRQALEKCFLPEPSQVGCFNWFTTKHSTNQILHWLAPSQKDFFYKGTDQAILQKSLTILYHHGLCTKQVVSLSLELTKHPCFQKKERAYQAQYANYHYGMLSSCKSHQDLATCMATIFTSRQFSFIFPKRTLKNKKRKPDKRKGPSYTDIYIRSCR